MNFRSSNLRSLPNPEDVGKRFATMKVTVAGSRVVGARDEAYAEYRMMMKSGDKVSPSQWIESSETAVWCRWKQLSTFEKTIDDETRKALPPFPNKPQWIAVRLTGWATDNAHLKEAFLEERSVALQTYFDACAATAPRAVMHFFDLIKQAKEEEEQQRDAIPTADATLSTAEAMDAPYSPMREQMATKLAKVREDERMQSRYTNYVAVVVVVAAIIMGMALLAAAMPGTTSEALAPEVVELPAAPKRAAPIVLAAKAIGGAFGVIGKRTVRFLAKLLALLFKPARMVIKVVTSPAAIMA